MELFNFSVFESNLAFLKEARKLPIITSKKDLKRNPPKEFYYGTDKEYIVKYIGKGTWTWGNLDGESGAYATSAEKAIDEIKEDIETRNKRWNK